MPSKIPVAWKLKSWNMNKSIELKTAQTRNNNQWRACVKVAPEWNEWINGRANVRIRIFATASMKNIRKLLV